MLTSLWAENITLMPYLGIVNYDADSAKAVKKDANFLGLYASVGDASYKFEAALNHQETNYKDNNFTKLAQNDFMFSYGTYSKHMMAKAGLHVIVNNEAEALRDLGSGYVGIATGALYYAFSHDTITLGLDAYYSMYMHAHDEVLSTPVTIIDVEQFTPMLSYLHIFSDTIRNEIIIKGNYVRASQYKDQNYLSYEIRDTYRYENFFTSLKYFGGEMKSGVHDGGLNVTNTKDLQKQAMGVRVGFYFSKYVITNLSYERNSYKEYNNLTRSLNPEGTSKTTTLSVNIIF